MKTMCIKLPRSALNEAIAIYETTWNITTAGLFEQLLDELHDSLTEPFSCEMVSTNQLILMCFTAREESTLEILASAIYAMIPDAQIVEIPDYTHDVDANCQVATMELRFARSPIYAIQNFCTFKFESLQPVAGVLSQLPTDDRIIIQFVCKRMRDSAYHHFKLDALRAWDRLIHILRVKYWFKRDVMTTVRQNITTKCKRKMYNVTLRIAAIIPPQKTDANRRFDSPALSRRGKDPADHLRAIAGAFAFVNTPDDNSLKMGLIRRGLNSMRAVQRRAFGRKMMMSPLELTTLWHPPKLSALPNTAGVLSTKAGPPTNVPQDQNDPEISFFGRTDFREHQVPFGIRRFDRRRHLYVVGKSGTGKSCMLQLLIRNDIENGYGAAVLDPHGDLIDDILRSIPEHRVKDVVLFDPTDLNFPPSFNPLADVSTDMANRITLNLVGVFKHAFGAAWNDQVGHVLRYALLALLSQSGTTLLSLRRFLIDDHYRDLVLEGVEDDSVRYFWRDEFEMRREELQATAVAPLLNRLGQLFATDMVRNILGQPLNRFDFREIIDNKKILLMKLSKGILGDDSAALLGSIVISKIYAAAMSRADLAPEHRQDFYFYIDEFQNFATDTFDEILSESRKYRLNLTMANQFLGQLPEKVRRTLFGNIGNILTFRSSGEDAGIMAKEFSPRFSVDDIINLGLREFYVKMAIDGQTQDAFSGRTLDLEYPSDHKNFASKCIEYSRNNYALPLKQVRELLSLWEEGVESLQETANS